MSNQNKPPKVLHVSTIAVTLAKFISPISSHLRDRGWQVDAAAFGVSKNKECLANFVQCLEVPFERKLSSIANITVARRAIREIVQQQDYDIVHVHTPIASFMTRNALRKKKRGPTHRAKVVYTAHGFHFYNGAPWLRNKLFSTAERIAAPWMDHLIVINRQDYANAEKYRIATSENMTYMSGIGVDLSEFNDPPNKASIRNAKLSEIGVPKDSYVFLQIAEYTPNKRHCDTIRAFAALPNDRRYDLFLAGEGTTMEATKELAIKLGVESRVHFLGYRTDIMELLATCDATLLVSQREGLPLSIMEAMAMGKKIIGTNIRGTSDLLRDGVGILVPPCEHASLSVAMLESVEFKPNLKQAEAVLEACSLPTIIDQHIALYSKLLGRNASTCSKDA